MAPDSSQPSAGTPKASAADYFATTRWSVILSAGRASSSESRRALAELCQTYWYPLYTYVRRRGRTKEDAEDLVQAFFERFLEKDYLADVHADRGRFRAFLLASLQHFLANEHDKAQRQKRGGGIEHLSLDWQTADERFHLDPPDPATPEQRFDREWALALLERVIVRLQADCAAAGRAQLFEQAKGYLTVSEAAIPYAQAAQTLGMEEGAVRVAVHRLRKLYREILRDEIAQTLADPSQIAEELRSLQAALSS